jgi:hypothetical protein
MSALKATILAAVATAALASPVLAQNFQGFGAPSSVTEGTGQTQQSKPVKLKTHQAR